MAYIKVKVTSVNFDLNGFGYTWVDEEGVTGGDSWIYYPDPGPALMPVYYVTPALVCAAYTSQQWVMVNPAEHGIQLDMSIQ